jgi:hypothetical protein
MVSNNNDNMTRKYEHESFFIVLITLKSLFLLRITMQLILFFSWRGNEVSMELLINWQSEQGNIEKFKSLHSE